MLPDQEELHAVARKAESECGSEGSAIGPEKGGGRQMSFTFKLIVLAAMLFCHIVDDYYLQGILANLKQIDWWKNTPSTCDFDKSMYKRDYIIALVEHAFSWSFVMSIPLLIMAIHATNESFFQLLIIGYIGNTIIHALVDHLKANLHLINLVEDQAIHFVQIFLLWSASLNYFA